MADKLNKAAQDAMEAAEKARAEAQADPARRAEAFRIAPAYPPEVLIVGVRGSQIEKKSKYWDARRQQVGAVMIDINADAVLRVKGKAFSGKELAIEVAHAVDSYFHSQDEGMRRDANYVFRGDKPSEPVYELASLNNPSRDPMRNVYTLKVVHTRLPSHTVAPERLDTDLVAGWLAEKVTLGGKPLIQPGDLVDGPEHPKTSRSR